MMNEIKWSPLIQRARKVKLVESKLLEPLSWREPKRVFINSVNDIFHETLSDEAIDRVFSIMAVTPHIIYQVLTKRPARMQRYLMRIDGRFLTNVWLGVNVENQAAADERIPLLLRTPAAKRFVSAEPLLGPVDLSRYLVRPATWDETCSQSRERHRVDWVIVGGEIGPGARPMHPEWVREIRDQCVAARVPFFFRQWGEWAPLHTIDQNAKSGNFPIKVQYGCARIGKEASGRLLDGREWNEVPA